MKRNMRNIRNIGIMAHVDAGKTTLSEQLLFRSGRIHRAGRIDDGDTVLDFSPEEAARGITIDSAATCFDWTVDGTEHRVHLVDTPGHVDFTLEVDRALRVLDGAVAVFCAVSGVEPQSETVWRQADAFELPRIAFINKMDLAGADFEETLRQIRVRLDAMPIALQRPMGEGAEFAGAEDVLALSSDDAAFVRLVDELSALDDELLNVCVTDKPSVGDVRAAIRRLTVAGMIVPVLCGSALGGVGVDEVLDAVVRYLPSPLDRPIAKRQTFAGLVFKVLHDDYAGELTFVRVYSGTLRRGDTVVDVGRDVSVRVGRLNEVHADTREEVDELGPGTIGAVLGLRGCEAGTTLCCPNARIELASIPRPVPVVWMRIEPAKSSDRVKLSAALNRLCREDPSLRVRFDEETRESLIGGQGELQLEVARTRLLRRDGVEAAFGKPEVAYRETIVQRVEHRHRLKKQSGGPGMFAEVRLQLEPAKRGDGVIFIDSVTGGAVPRDYVSAVEAGIGDAATAGPRGYPVTDVCVVLTDGATHPNDSSAHAFRLCAAQAFTEAVCRAEPRLLEPVMNVVVSCPRDKVGDVVGELERRRGRVTEVVSLTATTRVRARAPLGELFGFANALRTLASGRAHAHTELAGYELKC